MKAGVLKKRDPDHGDYAARYRAFVAEHGGAR
jgi:hypothetical protein